MYTVLQPKKRIMLVVTDAGSAGAWASAAACNLKKIL
jgi:hypothetical protein